MTRVYVGIGSNIDRDTNIKGGIVALKKQFGDVIVSRIYESPAFGFEGDNFYNLVAGFDTSYSLNELAEKLRAIEYFFGRKRLAKRFLPRTLDIDLLLFGNMVCRHWFSCSGRERSSWRRYESRVGPGIGLQERHPEL